ncbi:MAG: hypothetical protein Q9209_007422 [Squamulea sp. 1 TL-2023]
MFSQWLLPLLLLRPLLTEAIPAPPMPTSPAIDSLEGNWQEFDDVCPNYKICSERGWRYWNTLGETLQNPNARDRTDGFALFQQYYTTRMEKTKSADSDWAQEFKNEGIDSDHLDLWVTVDKSNKRTPYRNSFNTKDGVIVAEMNFRSDDQTKKLEWSELMYQTWQAASAWADHQSLYGVVPHPKGGPISNLKSVIQSLVVNDQTMAIIRRLYEANGFVPEEDVDWRKWTEDGQPAFWLALLGTDNIKGTVYLLNDHPQEIGRKVITEIWTKWEVMAPDIW